MGPRAPGAEGERRRWSQVQGPEREPGAGSPAGAAGRPRSAPGPPPSRPAQRPPRPEAVRARNHSRQRVRAVALRPQAPEGLGMPPRKAGSEARPLSSQIRIFGPRRFYKPTAVPPLNVSLSIGGTFSPKFSEVNFLLKSQYMKIKEYERTQ